MPQILHRHQRLIFILSVLPAVFFLFALDSPDNTGFTYSMKMLSVPLAIIFFGYTWRHIDFFREVTSSSIKPWGAATVYYMLALLFGWPCLMGVNALIPSKEKVTIKGYVVSKALRESRRNVYTTHEVVIEEITTKRRVTYDYDEARYNQIQVGDFVEDEFKVGGLGFAFRWKL